MTKTEGIWKLTFFL